MKHGLFGLCVLWLLAGCGGEAGEEGTTVPTTVPVVLVEVPDLVGESTEYAQGAADVAGLSLLVVESPDLAGDPDVVVEQLPAAGEVVEQWSSLVVRVPSPPVRLPEVVELSPQAVVLLEEDSDVRVGEAATTMAVDVLEDDPGVEHNPFAVMVRFDLSLSVDQIEAALVDVGGSVVGESLDGEGLYLIETLANPEEVVEVLEDKDVVVSAGLDTVLHLTATSDDPQLGAQWGLGPAPGVNAFAAWDVTTGGSVVAVIDSGIDFSHPDLASQIWTNPGEVPNNGLDDDNNGLVDDFYGWDYHNWDADPSDDNGHGTHVAGTIAAVANNAIGVAGVAPGVKIMPLKITDANGAAYLHNSIFALMDALIYGADISNHSYGGYYYSPDMAYVIQVADAYGHLVVAAAGNDGSNNDGLSFYPSSYPSANVVSVAAVDQSGNLAGFSNYGASSVDVAAPGIGILSTTLGGGYGTKSGTSMAAPHVAGVAALLRSVSSASPSTIRQTLIDSAQPNGGLSGRMVSGGTVDAFEAIRSLDSTPPQLISTTPVNGAVGVPADTNIVLTFNEPVTVAGVASITIHRSEDGSVVETIPTAATLDPGESSTQVTVNPVGDLPADTGFYVTIDPGAYSDLVGNPYAGITDPATLSFRTADVGEPTLVSSTPVDDATGVPASTNITLVFSEDVNLGEGAITLVAHDGDTVLSTQVFDTAGDRGTGEGQIGGHGTNTLVVNPTGDLASHTDYYLTIATTAVTDKAGNPYAGISDPAALGFTTADTIAPQLISTTPVDGATGVAVDTNITLSFTEDVSPAAGNITIHDATNGGIAATIPVTSARVTTEGAAVTIDPAGELASNANFWVNIAPEAFTDAAGNTYPNFESPPPSLIFTTADTTAPVLATTNPLDGATGVAVDTNITLTFSEEVYTGTSATPGGLTIHRSDDGTVVESIPATSSQVTGSGTATITVDPTGTLTSDTDYYINIDPSAFQDADGNAYSGITDTTSLGFTTIETTPPQLVSTVPVDNATGVAVDTDIVLTFNEPVVVASGAVIVHLDDAIRTIRNLVPVTDDRVTGSGTTTITIDPGEGGLDPDGEFYISVDSGAFEDLVGNAYAGIGFEDATTWNFVTADLGEPTLVSSTPADGATGVAVDTNLVFVFDEPVYTTTGDVTILRSDTGTVVESIPVTSAQVTGSGTTTITVNPTGELLPPGAYYINATSGAFQDGSGNPYAGIANATSLNFTSAEPGAPLLVSSTPADDATGVPVDTDITLVFDEPVYAPSDSTPGYITIHTGSNIQRISPSNWRVTGLGTTTVTVNPSSSQFDTGYYYVTIDWEAFEDVEGNRYAGIADSTTLNFTTSSEADTTPPIIISATRELNTWTTAGGFAIVIEFDEVVNEGWTDRYPSCISYCEPEDVPSGYVQVGGSGFGQTVDDGSGGQRSRKILSPGGVDPTQDYYYFFPSELISDQAGNYFTGATLLFPGAASTPPALVSTTPVDGETNVPVDTDLTLVFNESVTAESGDITIHNLSDGSIVQTIPASSWRVSGTGTDTITVNLNGLQPDTGYYVNVDGSAFGDVDDSQFAGVTDSTTWNFTTGDNAPPVLVSTSPADDATDLAVDANITLTFNEPVYATTGTITIRRSADGTLVETIPITSSQVTGSGTIKVTVNPSETFDPETGYYVNATAGTFNDITGNPYAGIDNSTAFNFTTEADTAPLLVTSTPADGATGISVATDIVLVFDKNVFTGTGNISLYKTTLPDVPHKVASATNWRVTGSGTNQITFDTSGDLTPGTDYYVNVDPGALNTAGGTPFAGITNATTLNFTTAEAGIPTLVSTTPINGATSVPVNSAVVFTFSEPVVAGTGDITIHNLSDGSTAQTIPAASWRVAGSGTTTITVNPDADLAAGTGYYLNIAATAFTDIAGNSYAGITDTATLNFTTVEADAPSLTSTSPADNAIGVSTDTTSIVFTFSEPVFAGTGTIRLSLNGYGGSWRNRDVADSRFTGWGTSQITWNFDSYLYAESTNWDVQIPAGAFLDADGNTYPGTIEGTLNFTTGDTSGPKLGLIHFNLTMGGSTNTPGAAEVPVGHDVVLKFDETVTAVAGNVTIHRHADGSIVEQVLVTGSRVTGSGTSTITVNPVNDFPEGTVLYVSIDSGAFADQSGNPFVGDFQQSGPGDYEAGAYPDYTRFTTADASNNLLLVSTVPADDATGVAVDTTLVLNFNQNTCFMNGGQGARVYVHRLSDGLIVHTAESDTLTGKNTTQITVTLPPVLSAGTAYYVKTPFPSGMYDDNFHACGVSNSSFAGITDTTTLNFTTASDTAEPTLVSFTPANGTTGVAVDANIVLTFVEPVDAETGNITIHKTADGSTVETIPAAGGQVTGTGTTTITINPTANLAPNTGYYINVDATAFDDTDGNSFAGITGSTTVGFTTIDTGAPTLASSTPADNATDVTLKRSNGGSPQIVLTFSEPVCRIDGKSLRLRKTSDGSIIKEWVIEQMSGSYSPAYEALYPTCSGTGDPANWATSQTTIYLDQADGAGDGWPADTAFYLDVDPGAFADDAGNPWVTDATTLNFTTTAQTDTTPPTIVSATREWDGTNNKWKLVLTFSELIQSDSSCGNGGDFIAFSASATSSDGLSSGRTGHNVQAEDGSYYSVIKASLGFTVAEVDPAVDYYWIFEGGKRDAAGNCLAAQVVHFPGSSAPVLNSASPPVSIGVPVDTNIVLTFNETVVTSTGNVTIHQTSGGSVVETIPAASGLVTGSGTTTITINPSGTLSPNTGYYVNVDSSAFTDTDGAAYAGITDSTTLSFTTGDSTPPVLVSTTPAAGATGVAIDTDIVFTFDEFVYSQYCTTLVYSNNHLTIHLASDGSIVHNTGITAGRVTGGTGSGCDFTDATQITWDLSPDVLLPGTSYYINILPITFMDAGGNTFPGVSDSTTLTFTTAG